MAAVVKNLEIEQGTTTRISFQWRTAPEYGAEPRDLTGWKFRMQGRRRQQDPLVLINATTENGKIIPGADPTVHGSEAAPDPTNGWVTIKLSESDTNVLTMRSFVYDLEAVTPDGEVYRLMKGTVAVDANITQIEGEPVVEG